jgi:hypothetical protein
MGKVTINQDALNSVISKFAGLGNNFTPQQVESLVKSMSSDEKFIVKVMMDGTNPQVQRYVSQISDGLKASIQSGTKRKIILKSLKPAVFTLAVYLTPVAVYLGKKLGLIKEKWKLATGTEIDEKSLKIIAAFVSNLSETDEKKVFDVITENPEILVKLAQSEEGKRLHKELTGVSYDMTPQIQNDIETAQRNIKEKWNKLMDEKNKQNSKIDLSTQNKNTGETTSEIIELQDEVQKLMSELEKQQ